MPCKNCGANVKNGIMFCKKCGANVQTGIVPTAYVMELVIKKHRRHKIKVAAAIIAIAIIIAVGLAFFLVKVMQQ